MLKEFRYRSAHGNYVRVLWTPDGLLVQHAHDESPKAFAEDVSHALEFCGQITCGCPQARYIKPEPAWWPKEKA